MPFRAENRTSAREYGSIKPREDEIGPAIRQDSAPDYRPNATGISPLKI